MTDQEQRIAIHEALGWERDQHFGGPIHWHKGSLPPIYEDELPDYLNDLNAMHSALNTLSGEQREQFVYELLALLGINCDEPCTPSELATAILAEPSIQAEAFLRTTNKWK